MSEEMNSEKSRPEGTEEAEAARKRKLKKLVYANLVGAGLLGAVGFSSSAHGNASSHPGTGVTWNLDDFKVNTVDNGAHAGPARDIKQPQPAAMSADSKPKKSD